MSTDLKIKLQIWILIEHSLQPALLNSGGDNLLVSGSYSGDHHSQASWVKLCFLSLLKSLFSNPRQHSSALLSSDGLDYTWQADHRPPELTWTLAAQIFSDPAPGSRRFAPSPSFWIGFAVCSLKWLIPPLCQEDKEYGALWKDFHRSCHKNYQAAKSLSKMVLRPDQREFKRRALLRSNQPSRQSCRAEDHNNQQHSWWKHCAPPIHSLVIVAESNQSCILHTWCGIPSSLALRTKSECVVAPKGSPTTRKATCM